MKSLWRSVKPVGYRSCVQCASKTVEGVRFTIRRISLARRIELAQAVRDLARELECRRAGDSTDDRVEAAVLSSRIDEVYLRWGLVSVSGFLIDGETPDAEALFGRGPEALVREIVERIKSECGLTGDERKN
jgi:hypothetical protein